MMGEVGVHLKFSLDLTYQKLFKSVFDRVIQKMKRWTFFSGTRGINIAEST